jgi:hypothetical protein
MDQQVLSVPFSSHSVNDYTIVLRAEQVTYAALNWKEGTRAFVHPMRIPHLSLEEKILKAGRADRMVLAGRVLQALSGCQQTPTYRHDQQWWFPKNLGIMPSKAVCAVSAGSAIKPKHRRHILRQQRESKQGVGSPVIETRQRQIIMSPLARYLPPAQSQAPTRHLQPHPTSQPKLPPPPTSKRQPQMLM